MPGKRFSSEQIIATLRQIEVQLPQGKNIALACKEAATSEQNLRMSAHLSFKLSVQCQRPPARPAGLPPEK